MSFFRKKLSVSQAVIAVLFVCMAFMFMGYRHQWLDVYKLGVYKLVRASSNVTLTIGESGYSTTVTNPNISGATVATSWLKPNEKLIDGIDDLEANGTSGTSFFRIYPGITYYVDTTAIANNNGAWSGTTGINTFSMVTGVPVAADSSTNGYTAKVVKLDSSVTPVTVFPPIASAATEYNKEAYAGLAQTLFSWYMPTGADHTQVSSASAVSDWMVSQGAYAEYRWQHNGTAGSPTSAVSMYKVDGSPFD